jgi:hypothetical protein
MTTKPRKPKLGKGKGCVCQFIPYVLSPGLDVKCPVHPSAKPIVWPSASAISSVSTQGQVILGRLS